jgi:hypothetical protein
LHDGSNLDSSGIPALIVASTAFVQAAEVQAKALGYDPTIVWVPHPIQDRTDAEVRAIADKAFDEIVGRMTGARG